MFSNKAKGRCEWERKNQRCHFIKFVAMESFTWHMVIQEVLQDSIFKNQRRKGGKE
jgi:hypothetical protein